MISDFIPYNLPPQMKLLNMVIHILMYFCSFVSNWGEAAHYPTKCDIINDVKVFQTVYSRLYCCKFLTLSNQTWHYKMMCIRIKKNRTVRDFDYSPTAALFML